MASSTQSPTNLPVIAFEKQQDWADWLEDHHANTNGIWVRLAKKASGIQSLSYDEALDVALCYGWIDSQKKGFDDQWWLQKFTPRRARSIWSKRNRQTAKRLIASGEMKPSGLRTVEEAKENGQWDKAYDPPSTATVPDDFQKELDNNEGAKIFFASLNSRNRYAILHRIQTAKKPQTRKKRIQQSIEMLKKNEKIYP